MRTVLYQLEVEGKLVDQYCDKVMKDIRALKDAKKGWTYLNLTGLDNHLLSLHDFIQKYLLLQAMRDLHDED